MISKNLLSEVLGVNCERVYNGIWQDYPKSNQLSSDIKFKYVGHETLEYINIYELAHKCKEWAFKKGFEISSSKRVEEGGRYIAVTWKGFAEAKPMEIEATEPEAIFKACQWIYDNFK